MFATLSLALLAAPQGNLSPLMLQRVLPPGSLQGAVDLVSRQFDQKLYIVQLDGRIQVVENGGLWSVPFVDLRSRVELTSQTGLRALAFHPDYLNNGYAYVWYDAPGQSNAHDVVLARVTRSTTDPFRLDPATLVELLRHPQTALGHGGGRLAFGPDGKLYGGLGDGGQSNDPECNAQDPTTLMGKMFRIDVDAGFPYAVPPDNPFVGVPGARGEIWHDGLRHPWKWAFDRVSGDLWIADVGESGREEINLVRAGARGVDFGWKVMEGTLCNSTQACAPGLAPCNDPSYAPPLYEYSHASGCSVTGGYVYRGAEIPDLYGVYVFSDFCSGRVWALRGGPSGVAWIQEIMGLSPQPGTVLSSPSTFGEDTHGELWVADIADGELFKLVRRSGVAGYCVASPNSAGPGAELDWSGSVSVAAQDLGFTVTKAPPASFGVIFYGDTRTDVPLGNGRRCVGGALYRLPVLAANAQGSMSLSPSFTAPPFGAGPGRVQAGTTWNFQCWYRDIGGPGGSTFNLTDALSILFAP